MNAPAARGARPRLSHASSAMILPLHDPVRDRVRAILAELYGEDGARAPRSRSNSRRIGHLAISASPVAFELARRLRKAPRLIAQEIAARFRRVDGMPRVEAGAQRLSQRLSRSPDVPARSASACSIRRRRPADAGKTIVEHTAINPNKAAHIGHLRNSALGDTLVRVLGFRGTPVEIQNYIDDTGVQVADVVVGFRELEGARSRGRAGASPTRRASTTTAGTSTPASPSGITEDKERLKIRGATLHDIEHGVSPVADIASLRRRSHRPLPPEDDGAAQHRLSPADVGRRHPAAAVLGARVRGAASRRAPSICRPKGVWPAAG